MGWLWLIIAIITFAVSMYIIGRHFSDDQDVGGFIFAATLGSVAWPLILAVVVVFGPFFGLFYLGAYRAEKAKENSKKSK